MPPYISFRHPQCEKTKHKYKKAWVDGKLRCTKCDRSKEEIEHRHRYKTVKLCSCGLTKK